MSIAKPEYQKIATIVKDGSAFINPIADQANAFNAQAQTINPTELANKAKDVAEKLNLSNPDEFANDFSELQTKIDNATTSINAFKGHVDQLSGRIITGEKNLVALMELTTAAQQIMKECSDNPDDDKTYKNNPMNKVFGSVLDASKHVNKFLQSSAAIQSVVDFFTIEGNSDWLDALTENEKIIEIRKKIDELHAKYDQIKEIVDAAKALDEEGYEDVKKEVLAQVMATALPMLVGDRCANQVMSKIQTPELKSAIKMIKRDF